MLNICEAYIYTFVLMEKSETNQRVAVIGGGSWSTAIVKILSNNLDKIDWWMRNEQSVKHINDYGHNPNYLSSVEIDLEKVFPTNHIEKVIEDNDILILAVPSAFLSDSLKDVKPELFKGKTIFSAIKGIIPEENAIVGSYMKKHFNIEEENFGIICGPCHAEEVALEKLSYLTIACKDSEKAAFIAEKMSCRYIKTTTSEDVYGTEISAIYKNVIAIACGICHGLGYGDNFQAVLISNAIQEIERFVDAVSPVHRDVLTSAYLGDLLVTGYSQFSRNRLFGTMLGKGYSVRFAHLEMNMVAEGYYAVKSIHELNENYKVDIPIAEAVYNIIYQKYAPGMEMRLLADKLS